MKTIDKPIIVKQLFNKSIKEVWSAITDRDLMTKWFRYNQIVAKRLILLAINNLKFILVGNGSEKTNLLNFAKKIIKKMLTF